MTVSALRVVVVYPDLLGTYGDGGNGLILARRATWRDIAAELVEAWSDRPLPAGDLYCLGGGEDGPQAKAAALAIADGGLARAVEGGAAVLAVCAGYQIIGRSFPDAGGRAHDGIGLLDVVTVKSPRRRAVGEVVAEPAPGSPLGSTLTGFENHGGVTSLGPEVRPLAGVVVGTGNGGGDGTEGAWRDRVVGTYLHGPVLARNPGLADLLLGWATGEELSPLDDDAEMALRAERIGAAQRGHRKHPGRWPAFRRRRA